MSTTQIFFASVAALIVFGPGLFSIARLLRPSGSVSYQQAMLALSVVRSRLIQTGGVPDDAGKAIEVVTHALVDGSDK